MPRRRREHISSSRHNILPSPKVMRANFFWPQGSHNGLVDSAKSWMSSTAVLFHGRVGFGSQTSHVGLILSLEKKWGGYKLVSAMEIKLQFHDLSIYDALPTKPRRTRHAVQSRLCWVVTWRSQVSAIVSKFLVAILVYTRAEWIFDVIAGHRRYAHVVLAGRWRLRIIEYHIYATGNTTRA